jgi:hypothetical protein
VSQLLQSEHREFFFTCRFCHVSGSRSEDMSVNAVISCLLEIYPGVHLGLEFIWMSFSKVLEDWPRMHHSTFFLKVVVVTVTFNYFRY